MWKEKTKMYSSSLFQFYETRQRKLWKWWHIYKQHVILICRGALVAFKSIATSAQHSMALSYGKIHVQEQHCPRLRLVTGVDISCYPGDIHPWTRCITLGELGWKQSISFSPGFPSIIPTDQKKSFTLNHTLAILHCSRSKNLFRVTLFPFSEQVESLFLFSGVSRVCLCLGATTPSKLWTKFLSKSKFEISTWACLNLNFKIQVF